MSEEILAEGGQPCGARFFDEEKRDLGRAVQVTRRFREGSTLTVLDVAGAEPGLMRALALLDRSRLKIFCEDAARTYYVFRWASGYGNGADVRIQGVLEPRTGREGEGLPPLAKEPAPSAEVEVKSGAVESWLARQRKRRW